MSIVLKELIIPLCDLRLQQSVSYSKLNNIQFKKTEVHKKNRIKINQEEDNTDNDPDFYTEGEDHEDTSSEDDNDDEDTSSEEENNTDNDPDFYTEKKKKNIKLVQDVLLKSKHNKILSAYEQMIKKNQEEKMAILQSLKLDEAKANLAEVLQKKSQSGKRKFTKTEKDISPPVLRKSSRLANFNVDLSENTLYFNAWKSATGEQKNRKIRRSKDPFKEDLESLEGYESFLRAVNIHKSISEDRNFSYNKTKKGTSPVLRKSGRLAKINVDLSEDTLYYNAIKAAVEELNRKA